MPDSFSQRQGVSPLPVGMLRRDQVPPSFRMFLLNLPSERCHFDAHELRKVICTVLQVWPDPHLSPYSECEKYLKTCEWFHIHEIIEGLYIVIREKNWRSNPGGYSFFAKKINDAFVAQNIGWQIDQNGNIVTRGDETFERTVTTAVSVLAEDQKPTAAGHLGAALSALSVRPQANTSGAVAHATNAVECVLGVITGETMTLGKYLDVHRDLFHPALKKGLDGIYGYASDEGARHGKEGTEPAREEAEFVVATCAAVCTLLTQKHAGARL
jgi:AbiJ N-terminal domain 4